MRYIFPKIKKTESRILKRSVVGSVMLLRVPRSGRQGRLTINDEPTPNDICRISKYRAKGAEIEELNKGQWSLQLWHIKKRHYQ